MNILNKANKAAWLKAAGVTLLALLMAGCAQTKVAKANDALAEAAQYYKAHADFFVEGSPAQLPADLAWKTGQEQPSFADENAVRGGVMHDVIADFPRTLRVVGPDSNGGFRGIILDENALSLVGQHPNTGEFFGVLAQAWAVSADKKTVYFKLDPAARFSDGEKITVDNYFFSFFFFLSTHISDPWYNNFYKTEYKQIVRYDDLTMSVTLPEAKANFLEKAGGLRPLPKDFYKELGADYPSRYQWRFEPTTGPYELRSADLKKGRSITMRHVKDWWAQDKKFFKHRYNVDAMEYTVVRDTSKAFELFLSGKLEVFGLGLPEYWYDRTKDAPAVKAGYIEKITFYNEVPRPTWGFYLNTQEGLMRDLNVRQGFGYSLNWPRVLSFFFRGDYDRMQTYAAGYGRYSHPTLKSYDWDLEAAKAKFEAAGFTTRGADGILKRADGTRLSITVTASEGPLNGVLMILKEEALKAGLEMNLEILDGTTAFKKISEKKHQAAFLAFNTSVERYPRYWEMFHSVNAKPQTNNLCNLTDPAIDAIIDRYDREVDENEIQKMSLELQERIHASASYIPAFMKPWYRVGVWRYLRFPKDFDVKTSRGPTEYGLYWIDETLKAETLKAMQDGKQFGPVEKKFEQWHPSSK